MRDWSVDADIRWRAEDVEGVVDARLVALLEGIAAKGSLVLAARSAGLSYRHAWSLLQPWVAPSLHALAVLRRGEGAVLTPLGSALLRRHAALSDHLRTSIADWHDDIPEAPAVRRLDCVASHDLLIGRLPGLSRDRGVDIDIVFRGSGEAVAALVDGRAALAGLHVPRTVAPALRRRMLAPLATLGDVRIVQLFVRTQGLMVAHASRRRVHVLADLARPGTRFVNRQRGSGTRQLLDALLAIEHVEAGSVDGYLHEEFTHAAVAATVAAGAADAGFGIAAAAAEFDLGFVPLVDEVYCLAWRDASLEASAVTALLGTLRSAAWRSLVNSSVGYALPSRIVDAPVRAR